MEHSDPIVIKPNLIRLLRTLNSIPYSHASEWIDKNIDYDCETDDVRQLYSNIRNIDLELLDHLTEFVDMDKSHEELADKVAKDNEEWYSSDNRKKCVQEFIDTVSSPGVYYLRYLQEQIDTQHDIDGEIESLRTKYSNDEICRMIKSNIYPIELYIEHAEAIVDCLLYFVNNQELCNYDSELGRQYFSRYVLWKKILEVIRYGCCCPSAEPDWHCLRDYESLFLRKFREIVASDERNPWYNDLYCDITTIYMLAYNITVDRGYVEYDYPLAPIIEYANNNTRKSARK